LKFKNLHKDKWQKAKLGDFATEYLKRIENPKNSKHTIFIGSEHLDKHSFFIKRFGNTQDVTSQMKEFRNGDVLIVRRSLYASDFRERASYVLFDGVCSGDIIVLKENDKKLYPKFLTLFLNTERIWEYIVANAGGSITRRIKWNELKQFDILLPPLPEQKLISDILYKIEETLEQTEKQEKALVEYRKEIVNTIFNHNEDFGTLLPKEKKKAELFGKVAKNIQKSEFNPLENGLSKFVGLEHIVTDNLNITSWGNIAGGTTFTKTFKAGQILFGKRRAYLKKVAVADFDGLCSGDILVFDAIEKKILPELLPYLLQNDAFFEYAVKNSAGSISPRAKWQDLVNFQLFLPDLKIQPKLVTLFKKIDNTIEQTRKHKEKLVAFKKGLLNELIG